MISLRLDLLAKGTTGDEAFIEGETKGPQLCVRGAGGNVFLEPEELTVLRSIGYCNKQSLYKKRAEYHLQA